MNTFPTRLPRGFPKLCARSGTHRLFSHGNRFTIGRVTGRELFIAGPSAMRASNPQPTTISINA